jgi:hypothetical protein
VTDRAFSRGSCTSADGQLAHQRVSRTSWEGPPGARTYTKVLGRTGWEARWCTCLNARGEARSAPYCWEAAEVAHGKEPAFLVRSIYSRSRIPFRSVQMGSSQAVAASARSRIPFRSVQMGVFPGCRSYY